MPHLHWNNPCHGLAEPGLYDSEADIDNSDKPSTASDSVLDSDHIEGEVDGESNFLVGQASEDRDGLNVGGDGDSDAMGVDIPKQPPILHAICSQIYNVIFYWLHDIAKFHEVQLELITFSLAGMTAITLPSKNH